MMPALRVEGWDTRLLDALARQASGQFVWGSRDCATLFAAAVEAITDSDPLAGIGAWSSERDAMRRLHAAGVGSMLEFVSQRFREIEPADARRGDLGFAADPSPLTCPLVIVGELALGRELAGPVQVPRTLVTRAFQVGR